MQKLASLPVKAAGLVLPDPVVTSQPNISASEVTNSHMMKGGKEFCLADQQAATRVTNAEIKSQRATNNKTALSRIISGQKLDLKRMILSGCAM
jgi:hypothetical protein